MKIRLDKWLSEMTEGSRTDVKKWIRQGRVRVGDQVIRTPETKVDEDRECVYLDNEMVSYHQFVYYMLNKPAGVVSATTDREHRTVVDLLPDAKGKNIFPVGRLDQDTEGLLLLTNDGELAHNLLSPKKHVDKTYLVYFEGTLTADDKQRLEEGIDIGDEKMTLPAVVESAVDKSFPGREGVYLTIREGRYHQIKRMFGKLGKPVLYLKRLRMGGLQLDESLEPGQYRELTTEEIEMLKV